MIEKRYVETLENLKIILPLVDYAKIYDNSEIYKLCYTKFGSEYIKVCEEVPEWLREILK